MKKLTERKFKDELNPTGKMSRSLLRRWKWDFYKEQRLMTPSEFYNSITIFFKNLVNHTKNKTTSKHRNM